MAEIVPIVQVGEAIVVSQAAATATGLFGYSLGATIGIAVVGVLVVAGITYFIVKKIKKSNSNSQTGSSSNIDRLKKDFKLPKLPEHDQLSSFSQAFSISSEQVKELEQAYMCQVSYTLMVDPVIGLCCKVRNYERVVIQAVIDQFGKCPFCQKKITKEDIMPNTTLQKGIRIFRKQLAKRAQRLSEQRIKEEGLD